MSQKANCCIGALLLAGALLGACGAPAADPPAADPLDPGPGDQGNDESECPGADPSQYSLADLARSAMLGRTDFAVTFVSPRCMALPEELEFRVAMTNHSCSIPGYDLELDGHVRLFTDDGADVRHGFVWDITSMDDHHPAGMLVVPARLDGAPVVGCQTMELSLEITGIDDEEGVGVAFLWEGPLLDPIRDCDR